MFGEKFSGYIGTWIVKGDNGYPLRRVTEGALLQFIGKTLTAKQDAPAYLRITEMNYKGHPFIDCRQPFMKYKFKQVIGAPFAVWSIADTYIFDKNTWGAKHTHFYMFETKEGKQFAVPIDQIYDISLGMIKDKTVEAASTAFSIAKIAVPVLLLGFAYNQFYPHSNK